MLRRIRNTNGGRPLMLSRTEKGVDMSSPFRPLAIVVCLCLALLLPRTIAHAQGTQVFIDNGTWRVLSAPFWGGAITGIEPSGRGTDFIDNGLPDTGRSIQM